MDRVQLKEPGTVVDNLLIREVGEFEIEVSIALRVRGKSFAVQSGRIQRWDLKSIRKALFIMVRKAMHTIMGKDVPIETLNRMIPMADELTRMIEDSKT